ncbi:MAG TPA: M56 family metallopeptidase [Tepidisphaeraceae bacterium]
MTMLLNSLLQGVVLAAAVYVLLMQFPRLNAATRYAVWYLTLLVVAALPLRPLVGFIGGVSTPAGVRGETNFRTSGTVHLKSDARDVMALRAPDAVTSPSQTSSRTWHPIGLAARPVKTAIIVIWSAASFALLVRLALGYRSLRRLKHTARPAPASLVSRVQLLAQRALPERRATLLVSENISTPIVLGLFNPVILIPASLVGKIGWTDFDHVALHELAHLRRYDDWMNLVQKVVEALLPIQPGLFWIGRQINLARETACDDCVIATTGSPKPYAESLTRIAELSCRARGGLLASGAAGNPSQLYRRVQDLLDRKGEVTPRVRVTPMAIATGVIGLLVWMSLNAPQVVALEQPAGNALAPKTAALADAPAAGAPAEPGTVSRSFTVAPGDKIAVEADQGNVHVGTWDKQTIQIIVTQKGPDLADYLKHHFISMTQEGHVVLVKTTGDSWNSRHDSKVQVEYQITIPTKLDGTFKSGAGDVNVTGTAGTIDVATGAGNVEMAQIAGITSGRTGSGNIDVADCRENLSVRTGEGNIDIHTFAGPSIEIRTGMGNIDAELSNQIKAESSFRSGMGDVSVTMPATMAVNLRAGTGMGKMHSQFPMGRLNGGGPEMSVQSGDGDIEIKKAN